MNTVRVHVLTAEALFWAISAYGVGEHMAMPTIVVSDSALTTTQTTGPGSAEVHVRLHPKRRQSDTDFVCLDLTLREDALARTDKHLRQAISSYAFSLVRAYLDRYPYLLDTVGRC